MTTHSFPITTDAPTALVGDYHWMRRAIEVAQVAVQHDKMPFGCVIVDRGGNELATAGGTGSEIDPTEHSEMLAIRHACSAWGLGCPSFLTGCVLVSTHQPCLMCAAAINHAKLSRVVFGSYRADIPHLFRPHPSIEETLSYTSHPPLVIDGVLREECVGLFSGVKKWD